MGLRGKDSTLGAVWNRGFKNEKLPSRDDGGVAFESVIILSGQIDHSSLIEPLAYQHRKRTRQDRYHAGRLGFSTVFPLAEEGIVLET